MCILKRTWKCQTLQEFYHSFHFLACCFQCIVVYRINHFSLVFTSHGIVDISGFPYLYKVWGTTYRLLIPIPHHLPHISDTIHTGAEGEYSRKPLTGTLQFIFHFWLLSGQILYVSAFMKCTELYYISSWTVDSFFMFLSCSFLLGMHIFYGDKHFDLPCHDLPLPC